MLHYGVSITDARKGKWRPGFSFAPIHTMGDDTSFSSRHRRAAYNPLRPYCPPIRHQLHNYTSIASDDATTDIILTEDLGEDHAALQEMTTSSLSLAAYKYLMTVINNPLDVATTLLQVQYAPHTNVEVIASEESMVSVWYLLIG